MLQSNKTHNVEVQRQLHRPDKADIMTVYSFDQTHTYRIRSSTDGFCAINILFHLLREKGPINELEAEFQTVVETSRGGVSALTMGKICKVLNLPFMHVGAFFQTFRDISITSLADNRKFAMTPCVLYTQSHTYLAYSPTSQYKKYSIQQMRDAVSAAMSNNSL